MTWNRDIANLFVLLLVLLSFILIIKKRNYIGKGQNYIIAAIGLSLLIEGFSLVMRYVKSPVNVSMLYIFGINLIVFFLFFLYFQSILTSRKLKLVNKILIGLFLLSYCYFAIYDEHFFTKFPFFSYFVEVVLLTCSIYLVMSQTFNSDKILNLGSYFPFWVCMSLLVTYLGVLPLLIAGHTATKLMNLNIFFAILFLVNVLGYGILLVGIIKVKKK